MINQWGLLFVCKVETGVAEAPGKKTVDGDLDITNFAALAYMTDTASCIR
nr:hypothetical protein [Haloarchaeobius litoreus]